MDEQKMTFLDSTKTATESIPGNIFQELEEELWADTLGIGDDQKKKNPIIIGAKISNMLFIVALASTLFLSIDSGIREYSWDIFTGYPSIVCSYLSIGVNADNQECKGITSLSQDIVNSANETEKNLANNLFILVPKRAQVNNVANSSEVQFIKQKSGKSRVAISSMIDTFDSIRNSASSLGGADIECGEYSINEKGEFSADCDVYGSALLSSSQKSNTSRMTAIDLLNKIQQSSKTGWFELMNYPKTLDIEHYSSSDPGIKSTFSTKTRLSLKLRYIALNQ